MLSFLCAALKTESLFSLVLYVDLLLNYEAKVSVLEDVPVAGAALEFKFHGAKGLKMTKV